MANRLKNKTVAPHKGEVDFSGLRYLCSEVPRRGRSSAGFLTSMRFQRNRLRSTPKSLLRELLDQKIAENLDALR